MCTKVAGTGNLGRAAKEKLVLEADWKQRMVLDSSAKREILNCTRAVIR